MEILWTCIKYKRCRTNLSKPKLLEMDINVGNNADYVSYGGLNEVPVYGRKNQFYGRINPSRGPIRGHADARHSIGYYSPKPIILGATRPRLNTDSLLKYICIYIFHPHYMANVVCEKIVSAVYVNMFNGKRKRFDDNSRCGLISER